MCPWTSICFQCPFEQILGSAAPSSTATLARTGCTTQVFATQEGLDGPAVRNANQGNSHESICVNGFAEKKKKTMFITFQRLKIRANRLKPAFGNPQAIRANRAISTSLEAQQRNFSYCAILSAMVSRNSFVLVFLLYRTSIERYVAKWGIALTCLCKTRHQGVSRPVGGLLRTYESSPRDPDIVKIVSVVNLLLCSEFTTRSDSLLKI